MKTSVINRTDTKINTKIYIGNNLKAKLDREHETLSVETISNIIIDIEDARNYKLFKELTLNFDSFGEAHSLEIKNFIKDGWSKNRDLVEYVLISHFDISEIEAKKMVDKILSSFD